MPANPSNKKTAQESTHAPKDTAPGTYANGNEQADGLIDPAIKNDTKIYPSPEMMGKLFALEAMPLNIDRIRTRVWNKVRTGS